MNKANPYKIETVFYHPVQNKLCSELKRFKCVAAGRRSGKTFRGKRNLVKEALRKAGLYFAAAPTMLQARYIFWEDLKAYFPLWMCSKAPNESRMEIHLKNGSEIRVVGLDKPQRFEGQPWTGGIIDEADDLKNGAWEANIRPALDTIGLNTWCWITGVPEGKKLLFDLSKKANIDDEWGFYHWKSAEILPKKAIEAAKRDLSALEFRQEYEASFDTAEGIVYSDYSSVLNKSNMILDPRLPIVWTHDFNYTPLSSAIIQEVDNEIHVLDEIVLTSAVAENAAVEFCERYKNHKNKTLELHGDYSGVAGEVHKQSSDYKVIENYLRNAGWKVTRKVKPNPLIKDGQNALRALICNANNDRRFFVRVDKCKYVDNGLSRVQLKKGSTFQEDETEFQHITTALRYFAHAKYPIKKTGYNEKKLNIMNIR